MRTRFLYSVVSWSLFPFRNRRTEFVSSFSSVVSFALVLWVVLLLKESGAFGSGRLMHVLVAAGLGVAVIVTVGTAIYVNRYLTKRNPKFLRNPIIRCIAVSDLTPQDLDQEIDKYAKVLNALKKELDKERVYNERVHVVNKEAGEVLSQTWEMFSKYSLLCKQSMIIDFRLSWEDKFSNTRNLRWEVATKTARIRQLLTESIKDMGVDAIAEAGDIAYEIGNRILPELKKSYVRTAYA